MSPCLIALGGNSPDTESLFEQAERWLAARGLVVRRRSRTHRTAPVGGPPGQPAYLNAAMLAETQLAPAETMQALLEVERLSGRVRGPRWGPRTLDLDLILWGETITEQPGLILPHPRMAFRRFVLEPAEEVAADMVHPLIGWTIGELARHARTRPARVELWSATPQPWAAEVARRVRRLRPPGEAEPLLEAFSLDHDDSPLQRFQQQPAPQLAVLLEPAAAPILQAGSAALAERLARSVRGRGRGPWLELRIASPAEAVEEVLAALQALR